MYKILSLSFYILSFFKLYMNKGNFSSLKICLVPLNTVSDYQQKRQMSSMHVNKSLGVIFFRKLNTQLKFTILKCLKRII